MAEKAAKWESSDSSKNTAPKATNTYDTTKTHAETAPPDSMNMSDLQAKEWGYDLYPDRRNVKTGMADPLWGVKHKDNVLQYRCEKKLVDVIKKSPLIRIMTSALNKAGCPVDFRRHVQCELCETVVTGGYDPVQNQVVICSNSALSPAKVHSVLFHEMIHMFDYCTKEIDFTNLEHLACTEIRAANLTYCSYLSAFVNGDIPRNKIKNQHKECVKKRAADSIFAVRPITREEANAAVRKVFDKCYKDLEPIGRRITNRELSPELAYSEGFLLGYD